MLRTDDEDDLALLIGSNTATVVNEILPGVKATAKKDTVRTRGGEAKATFTIEEGFTGAFEAGQRVEFEVQGLPEAVTIGMDGRRRQASQQYGPTPRRPRAQW